VAPPIDDALENLPDSERVTCMRPNPLFVSVQSRKGGVGKTTAALNLCRLLLEKDYEVLLLDLDITGTDITEGLLSPFWREHAVPVEFGAPRGKAKRGTNVLKLFETCFLAGQPAPRFDEQVKKGGRRTLRLTRGAINVIGSSIDAGDSAALTVTERERPSVLFDELHSYWLLEFIQGLATEFVDAVDRAVPDAPVAVVIDNSPGYTGLVPRIQDWLTDLGPERGRFLTISSFDVQDLIACGQSASGLHDKLEEKSAAYSLACGLLSEEHDMGGEPMAHDARFLVRLLQEKETRDDKGDKEPDLDYWLRGLESSAPSIEVPSITAYQGMLLNRVPEAVKRREFPDALDEITRPLRADGHDATRRLLMFEGEIPDDRMVSYNPYIEYQFIQSLLRVGRRTERRGDVGWVLKNIQQRSRGRSDEGVRWLFGPSDEPRTERPLENLRAYIQDLRQDVVAALQVLERFELVRLARLFRDAWLPGGFMRPTATALYELLAQSPMPFREMTFPEESYPKDASGERLNRVFDDIRMEAHEVCMRLEMGPPSLYERFLPSLVSVVVLSVGVSWWNPKLLHEVFGPLLGMIAAFEAMHWDVKRKPDAREGRSPYPQFLARDKLTQKDIREMLGRHSRGRQLFYLLEEAPPQIVSRAYNALTNGQARLLDSADDAGFLLDVILAVARETEESSEATLPYIDDLIEDVVVTKSLTHEAGRRRLRRGFEAAAYMRDFQAALDGILQRWGIEDEAQS